MKVCLKVLKAVVKFKLHDISYVRDSDDLATAFFLQEYSFIGYLHYSRKVNEPKFPE
jgi:hypothetical protein